MSGRWDDQGKGCGPGPAGRRGWVGNAMVLLAWGLLGNPISVGDTPRQFTLPGNMIDKDRQGSVEHTATNRAPALVEPVQPLAFLDQLRTLESTRALVQFVDMTDFRMEELTEIEIVPRIPPDGGAAVRQTSGRVYYSNWQRPLRFMVQTEHAWFYAGGTEFVVSVFDDRTEVAMFDGEVLVTNDMGRVTVPAGSQGVAAPGQPLVVRPLEARNLIQWWLYYPGVLDAAELEFELEAQARLAASLAAYATGDLSAALAAHPAFPAPTVNGTDAERVYYAALLLSVGRVGPAQALLDRLPAGYVPALALRTLIAAVRLDEDDPGLLPGTVTEADAASASWLLARSYWHQARHDLPAALGAARRAAEIAPEFGFAWARLAELEFGFGRNRATTAALARALALSPKNAQAHALEGFVLSARGRIDEAIEAFNTAIRIDGGLGNAWLGRGLCRIRQNDLTGGLEDLRAAAVLEPNRSLLRSYLGKAFAEAEDDLRALRELDFAVRLDPNDPTPWLYRALTKRQVNRPNEALNDLRESTARNQNRQLFRSRMLLDQDRAVRGANLAGLYRDLGLYQVSTTEAAKAVAADYGDPGAHRFLANTFDAQRDRRQVHLRYESAWLSEWLLANLLGPVGLGSISQNVSQQEYSRLFERNRAGLFSRTDTRTDGEWQQTATHYATLGRVSYALDSFYHARAGTRSNEDLEQWALSTQLKVQLTERDSVFMQVYGYEFESGDTRSYIDPAEAQAELRFTERQKPVTWIGYHREWSPGQHTLVLGGYLDNRIAYQQASLRVPGLRPNAQDGTVITRRLTLQVPEYASQSEVFTGEFQHIWQTHPHTFILGGRAQTGTTDTRTVIQHEREGWFPGQFPDGQAQAVDVNLSRVNAYGYYHLRVVEPLLLIAGLSYDRLVYPRNIDQPPIVEGQESQDQVSPKTGFVWTPTSRTTLRGAYTRSLGGVYHDASVRLEPSQVAGFIQAFRSAIPESVAGAVPGSRFESAGLALDQRISESTYLTLQGEWLRSRGEQGIGVVEIPSQVSSRTQELEFEERTLTASVHRLLSESWAAGGFYRVSRAQLEAVLVGVPASPSSFDPTNRLVPYRELESTLHQVGLSLRFNHGSGVFGVAESMWNSQDWREQGQKTGRGQDTFWQHNLTLGYRFARRRAELAVGVLNLTDEDYRLHPLNLHPDYPRSRTLLVTAKLDF